MTDARKQQPPIFTIGHGNKTLEIFIEELRSFQIAYLLDIRSSPYSKWHSHFNCGELEISLKSQGIKYVYLGDDLGGLPKDSSCYENGKVIYDKIRDKDFFKRGIGRLANAYTQRLRVALMCSESKPCECHRSKLIGEELLESNMEIVHIVGVNQIQPQEEVMLEVTGGYGGEDLFGEVSLTSRKSYQ